MAPFLCASRDGGGEVEVVVLGTHWTEAETEEEEEELLLSTAVLLGERGLLLLCGRVRRDDQAGTQYLLWLFVGGGEPPTERASWKEKGKKSIIILTLPLLSLSHRRRQITRLGCSHRIVVLIGYSIVSSLFRLFFD